VLDNNNRFSPDHKDFFCGTGSAVSDLSGTAETVTPACFLDHNSNSIDYTRKDISLVQLFRRDVVLKKYSDFPNFERDHTPGIRSEISEFSDASRRRLLFLCRNSGHYIKSQVLLTFHEMTPINGKAFKEYLNIFLTRLRKEFPGLHYLWCLEFHTKEGGGNYLKPHVHLFMDLEPSRDNRITVAKLWNVTTKESESNYKFTSHSKNFFPWKMESGSYMAKAYIAKSIQKDVPEHYKNVGRFWGASRNMKPDFSWITENLVQGKHLYAKCVRLAVKLYERRVRLAVKKYQGRWIRPNFRKSHVSKTFPYLADIFLYLLKYYSFYDVGPTGSDHVPFDVSACPSYELGVPF
jgi:hypothetical protein